MNQDTYTPSSSPSPSPSDIKVYSFTEGHKVIHNEFEMVAIEMRPRGFGYGVLVDVWTEADVNPENHILTGQRMSTLLLKDEGEVMKFAHEYFQFLRDLDAIR